MEKVFTVVIPTKNRYEDLNRLLESISNQTLLPQRVVIVDQSDKKSDFDYEKSSSDIEIKHLYEPQVSGLCAAKNLGVKYAVGDCVYFFDDDIILDNDFLKQ